MSGWTLKIHNTSLTGRPTPAKVTHAAAVAPALHTGTQISQAAANAIWAQIHTRALTMPAAHYIAWLPNVAPMLPCGECRNHWRRMFEACPPPSGGDLFAWSVARHNEVNRRLQRPEMPLADALQRWSIEPR